MAETVSYPQIIKCRKSVAEKIETVFRLLYMSVEDLSACFATGILKIRCVLLQM